MKELKRFVRGLIIEMRRGHPTKTTVLCRVLAPRKLAFKMP